MNEVLFAHLPLVKEHTWASAHLTLDALPILQYLLYSTIEFSSLSLAFNKPQSHKPNQSLEHMQNHKPIQTSQRHLVVRFDRNPVKELLISHDEIKCCS
jgi:hypothetical protein